MRRQLERIAAGRERRARLVAQGAVQCRIIGRHVGRIAEEQVEALAAERRRTSAVAELDACAEVAALALRNRKCGC